MAETPTPEITAALRLAVIYKATRILAVSGSPLGSWGEYPDGGVGPIPVRPDHTIAELLYGIRFVDWDVDLPTLVTSDDVIRVGLETDPTTYPAERVPDVEAAIAAASSWVAHYVLDGTGVA